MPEPATPGDDRCLAGLSAALTALPAASLERTLASLADALQVDGVVLLGLDPFAVRTIAGRERRVPGEVELPAACLTALADGRLVRGGPDVAAALVRPHGEPGAALIAPLPGLAGPPTAALALHTNLSGWTWTSGQEHALRGFAGGLAGWLAARGLQSVLDAAPQRIAWKDPALRYRGVNRAFTRASGQPPPIGRPGDDDRDDRDALTAGHGPRLETALLPGGREQWFWTSRAPLDGGGVLVVRDDVTAAIALATQLAQAHRTAAIGRLATGVGDDLRPILDTITADLAAIRSDPADADAHTRIDLALQSADDLARQLAAFARRQLVQPADVVPVQLLTRMEPTLARLLGDAARLRLAPVGLRCMARVDPRLFEQLLVALARHVRDHHVGGDVDLDVSADTLEPDAASSLALSPGEYVRVRLLATPALRPGEHGLRLALARAIASQVGGGLDITADESSTRIDIHLPRAFTARPEPETRPVLDIRGGETLLLVDDDPLVRSLLATVLRHLGYHVIASDTLEDAVDRVTETGPSGQVPSTRVALALVSAALPGQRPADTLKRLRSAAPELRVLWIAPGAAAPTTASDPLVVPCSFEALAVRVRQALDARAGP